MNIINMQKAGVEGEQHELAWESEVSLSAVGVSDAILIPDGVISVACTISVSGGGKGKVRTSTDKLDTILNGTPTWIDWDLGEVSADAQDVCLPVSALQLEQTFAGTVKLSVRAQ